MRYKTNNIFLLTEEFFIRDIIMVLMEIHLNIGELHQVLEMYGLKDTSIIGDAGMHRCIKNSIYRGESKLNSKSI